ncbi:MAG TPA: DNA repair protein RecN [Acholeplasmataceae bacterium]|nr:DNA repair protein RecN [Acholeplasmataceae bacterium]
MLSSITIQNFAIIDNITINFKPGLTVLTGETGAGKSIIIDAIGMLLGERASQDLIRYGADKAIIEGVFFHDNPVITEILNNLGIDDEDNIITIRREISANGKSISRVNGLVVNLSQLLTISNYLADIHTQIDSRKLFISSNYLEFIDNNKVKELMPIYLEKLKNYKNYLKKYLDLKNTQNKDNQMIEFYKYQFDELNKANLDLTEIDELKNELDQLNNFDSIYRTLSESVSYFQDNSIIDTIHLINNNLSKLSAFHNKYQEIKERLMSSYYEIEDIYNEIHDDLLNLEFDQERLDYINARLSFINNLKRKYQKDLPELIEYRDELSQKLDSFTNYDFYLKEYYQDVKKSHQELLDIALAIHSIRRALSEEMSNAIKKTLADLHLSKVELKITFDEVNYSDILNDSIFYNDGIDKVNFMISFNPGEPLKELSKVASGGEMSRVMLALKVHMLKNYQLPAIIFDEIDTGVSGEVALSVAEKLKEISNSTQVLAITHLPVVAGIANNHFLIKKEAKDDRVTTTVTEISEEERILEIAKMIAGENVTENSIKLAKEMIRR